MSDTSESLTLNQRVGGSKPSRRTGQSEFSNLGTLPSTHIAEDCDLRTVDARHLIVLAEAWEECAELDLALAATYRRHAAALRELVASASMVRS